MSRKREDDDDGPVSRVDPATIRCRQKARVMTLLHQAFWTNEKLLRHVSQTVEWVHKHAHGFKTGTPTLTLTSDPIAKALHAAREETESRLSALFNSNPDDLHPQRPKWKVVKWSHDWSQLHTIKFLHTQLEDFDGTGGAVGKCDGRFFELLEYIGGRYQPIDIKDAAIEPDQIRNLLEHEKMKVLTNKDGTKIANDNP